MNSSLRGMAKSTFDVEKIRSEFPILKTVINKKPLVYLDNAATTQKPRSVIEKVSHYYQTQNANIHRGVHYLSQIATEEYELARKKIQQFIHAASTQEIVFVRGTTEAINLIASSFSRRWLREGDEILISHMEHHSNIVPWQLVCEQTGARLRIIPITDQGEIDLEAYRKLFSSRTRIVSVVHVSNSLGTINPVKEMITYAHQNDVPVVLDGAQALSHLPVDVQELQCDYYAFSGHKIFGPTGIGVLYGKETWLEKLPPYQGGGDMIKSVTFEKTTFNELPYKFEAGTPHIAGAIGLAAAVDFITRVGYEAIAAHEKHLLNLATRKLKELPGIRIIGEATQKAAVISFVIEGIHPHDIGTILDHHGIAVRTGHHCTQPVMQRFNVPATARISFALYNTEEEVERLVEAIQNVFQVFGK